MLLEDSNPIEIEITKDLSMLEGSVDLNGRECYDFYRAHRKKKKLKIVRNYKLYKDVVNSLLRSIAELMIEKDGGVFIKDWGDFAVAMYPKKMNYKNIYLKGGRKGSSAMSRTRSYRYFPYFFGDISNRGFQHWTMDKKFADSLVIPIKKNINDGKLYMLSYTVLSGLVNALKNKD